MGWKVNKDIKMPQHDMVNDVLLFADILIIIYSLHSDIWCYDLLLRQWFKSKCILPKEMYKNEDGFGRLHLLKNPNSDNVHLLDFDIGDHYKTSICNIFPAGLYKARQQYFEPLVIGFLKKHGQNDSIPEVLKQLMLDYIVLIVKEKKKISTEVDCTMNNVNTISGKKRKRKDDDEGTERKVRKIELK